MSVQTRHFASVLLALDQSDGVVSSRYLTVGILKGIANANTINGQDAVSELSSGFASLDFDIHTFNI